MFLTTKPSVKRVQSMLPATWPVVVSTGTVAERLTAMSATPLFGELVTGLLSDPFWYAKTLWPHLRAEGPISSPRHAVQCAIVVAKQLLHYCYDLATGAFLWHRLVDGLNEARSIVGLSEWDHGRFFGWGLCSLWQALDAMVASGAGGPDPSLVDAAQLVHSAHEASIWDTTEALMDQFAILLRSAICVSAAIHKLHLGVVDHATKVPIDFKGLVRTMGPTKNADTIWRNYLVDLSCMWLYVAHFAQAEADPNQLLRILHKTHLWCTHRSLSESAARVKKVEASSTAWDAIIKSAMVLEWIYARLWDLALRVLNVKTFASAAAHKRALQRALFVVFGLSKEAIMPDRPEYGSAVAVNMLWSLTILGPHQMGLAYGDTTLLGADDFDMHVSMFASVMAQHICRTDVHLWAAVRYPQAWERKMDQGLPSLDAIAQRLVLFDAPWLPSKKDLKQKRADTVQKQRHACQVSVQNDIDAALELLA